MRALRSTHCRPGTFLRDLPKGREEWALRVLAGYSPILSWGNWSGKRHTRCLPQEILRWRLQGDPGRHVPHAACLSAIKQASAVFLSLCSGRSVPAGTVGTGRCTRPCHTLSRGRRITSLPCARQSFATRKAASVSFQSSCMTMRNVHRRSDLCAVAMQTSWDLFLALEDKSLSGILGPASIPRPIVSVSSIFLRCLCSGNPAINQVVGQCCAAEGSVLGLRA